MLKSFMTICDPRKEGEIHYGSGSMWISAVVLVIHAVFSWLLILILGYGLVGATIMLNLSWWVIVISQLLYIFITVRHCQCPLKSYIISTVIQCYFPV